MHANRTKEIAEQMQELFEETQREIDRAKVLDEIALAASGGDFFTDFPFENDLDAKSIQDYLVIKCGYSVRFEERYDHYWLHIRWD